MLRYSNPHFQGTYPKIWHFLLWKLGFYGDLTQEIHPPSGFSYPAEVSHFLAHQPYGLWIGHSSFLISVQGLHFLTDPVWSSYCSPIPIPAFKRNTHPPVSLRNLPDINCVLISHNHYDHLDEKTVLALNDQNPEILWIVPKKLAPWFSRRGISNVAELGWWESLDCKKFRVTAVPAQHFSGRSLWDKNKTHWNGYVVEAGAKKFYFVGDTGYNSVDFNEIGSHWNGIDLSLIPIGVYIPKRFMSPIHVSPDEAVQIHQDVRSVLSVGMHWKTFCLSEESFERPPYDLYLSMKEKEIPFSSFLPLDVGCYFNW